MSVGELIAARRGRNNKVKSRTLEKHKGAAPWRTSPLATRAR
jgi:hypothetical protein